MRSWGDRQKPHQIESIAGIPYNCRPFAGRALRKQNIFWRGARVVEWARLESGYTVYSRIEGSNPSLSARNRKPRLVRGFLFLVGSRVRILCAKHPRVCRSAGQPIGTRSAASARKGRNQGRFLSIPLSPPEIKNPDLCGVFYFLGRIRIQVNSSIRNTKPALEVFDFPQSLLMLLCPDLLIAYALVFQFDVDEIVDPAAEQESARPSC